MDNLPIEVNGTFSFCGYNITNMLVKQIFTVRFIHFAKKTIKKLLAQGKKKKHKECFV